MSGPDLDPLTQAQALIAAGIPVIICRSNSRWRPDGARDEPELHFPRGWHSITASECDLSQFRAGIDTLAMVAGHGIDVVDVDSKAGGSVENLPPFRRFGRHRTPSGGHHDFVVSTGLGKISPLNVNGRHVGDYAGGTIAGGGRLLIYLPGSTRPKYPDAGYEVEEPLDLTALLESEPDDDLIASLIGAGGGFAGEAGRPAAASSDVAAFRAEHAVRPERQCNYGRKAVEGLLADSRSVIPGTAKEGRHGWTVRSVARTVELIRAGCCWAGDLDALEDRLHEIKPEGGTVFAAVLSWALTNADGGTGCGLHKPRADATPNVDALWDARPELSHVRDFALARRAQPWAVLGVVLARIVTATPCWLVLPPLVGDVVPLNLFIGIVGKPGSGKGAATRAAARAVDVGLLTEANVGSGEGIAHMFMKRTKQGVEQHTTAVLFDIAEIDSLAALDARRGTTLLPELRKAWIGETLGFAYADPAKRLLLRPHTYRLTLVAGIQPTRAGVLLDDGDGGTPQRFLWLPAANPDAPDDPPAEPGSLKWGHPRKPVHATGIDGLVHVQVCQKARDAVVAEHLAQHRGHGEDLDAHAGLARLKVAAALGLFAGRYSITEQDWDLSGLIMTKSDATRAAVVAEMARTASTANTARAKAEATRQVIVSNTVEADQVKKAGQFLTRKLAAAGHTGMTRSDLRRAAGKHRSSFDEAIEGLIDTGQITAELFTAENGNDGLRYAHAAGAR